MNTKIIDGELVQDRNGVCYHKHNGYNYWHPVTRRHILTRKQLNEAIETYIGQK